MCQPNTTQSSDGCGHELFDQRCSRSPRPNGAIERCYNLLATSPLSKTASPSPGTAGHGGGVSRRERRDLNEKDSGRLMDRGKHTRCRRNDPFLPRFNSCLQQFVYPASPAAVFNFLWTIIQIHMCVVFARLCCTCCSSGKHFLFWGAQLRSLTGLR